VIRTLIGVALGILVAILVERSRRRQHAVEAPDLCERYRRAWAIPNDEIRG
jgi:uncharacterized membrane-anchored protein YhcB (DUF1043 family)